MFAHCIQWTTKQQVISLEYLTKTYYRHERVKLKLVDAARGGGSIWRIGGGQTFSRLMLVSTVKTKSLKPQNLDS